MIAALVLFLALLALEWLFWISPLAPRLEKLTSRLGHWYYLVPFHYLLRVAALLGVIYGFRPGLWPVFAGGAHWVYSVLWGLVLCAISWVLGLKMGQTDRATFARKAAAWQRADGRRFWIHAAYLLAYPGYVEELLFRWFFLAALWPVIGWWAVLLAPLLNLGWHLPVWLDYARHQQGVTVFAMAFPAAIFALVLTLLSALTHNLAGPVLAHGFSDWVGSVTRYNLEKAG